MAKVFEQLGLKGLKNVIVGKEGPVSRTHENKRIGECATYVHNLTAKE